MPLDRLVTPGMRYLYDPDRDRSLYYPGPDQHLEMTDTGDRVRWLDEQGIGILRAHR